MEKTIVIVYDKPNLLSLPYHDEQKLVRFLDFKPGLNEVGEKTWELVKKENAKRLKILSTVLKVFNPKPSEDVSETDKTKVAQMLQSGSYDVSVMEYEDVKTLVENTFERDTLIKYKAQEKKKTQPRNAIIKVIDEAIEAIDTVEKRVSEAR